MSLLTSSLFPYRRFMKKNVASLRITSILTFLISHLGLRAYMRLTESQMEREKINRTTVVARDVNPMKNKIK